MTLLSDKPFKVEIITPESVKFGGDAVMLSVPGVDGQMGILVGHAPILALLQAGRLTLQTRERTLNMAVGEGFVKMSNDRAVCLVDFAEMPNEIDRARAESQRGEIERELTAATTADQRDALQRRLRAAQARIDVAATAR